MTIVAGAEDSVNELVEGRPTALHYALSGGHEECVRVLLQYGADINSVTTTEEVRGKGERKGERGREREGGERENLYFLLVYIHDCRVNTSLTTTLRKILIWWNS